MNQKRPKSRKEEIEIKNIAGTTCSPLKQIYDYRIQYSNFCETAMSNG